MLSIIIGIVLVIFGIVSIVVCVARTPENLRGWYGAMFAFIALGSFIGGTALVLSGFGLF